MTADNSQRIGGILLAAGGSSRFGQPKQLFDYRGESLVKRSADALVRSLCEPVIAVLGARSEEVKEELASLPINVCINIDWPDGLSSSIKTGLDELLRIEPLLSAVVFTLCDQPLVSSADIGRLIEEFRISKKNIVAAEYGGSVGVPALFGREFFGELKLLVGDNGAKSLIRSNVKHVSKVVIENAAFDIDTPDDAASIDQ